MVSAWGAWLAMSELWLKWEGQVVDERFPLRRYLGGSDHSGVFLTEDLRQSLPNVAVKLVPCIPTLAESQLAHWQAAAALSHPHLISLFTMGRCQLGSLQCLYVAMEYAEQNLAQLLSSRPLSDVEVRDMLPPFLDALAFLHSRGLVQGQLKPSNILGVGDRLKLAGDTIRPAVEATTTLSMSSAYDPPEARDGSCSTAGDIWALGVTLFEALTQKVPARPDERSHGVVLPPDFPPMWADMVRECLSRRPADRPGIKHLQAWIHKIQKPSASEPALAPPPPPPPPPPAVEQAPNRLVIRAVVEREEVSQEPPQRRTFKSFLPSILGAVVILGAGWAGVRFLMSHSNPTAVDFSKAPVQAESTAGTPPPPPVETSPPPQQASAPPEREPNSPSVAGKAAGAVVHEEIPAVPRRALESIHGRVRVAVRVVVDESGAVVSDSLQDPGPSRYFAHVATEAAKKWKFASAADAAPRHWLVHFEFSRSGTTGHAVASNASARNSTR
jgi:serine/threonine protein kinase